MKNLHLINFGLVDYGVRVCSVCELAKPFKAFRLGSEGSTADCKSCSKVNYKRSKAVNKPSYIRKMLFSAKYRANTKGFEFNLTEADIIIPEFCPILGLKLEIGSGPGSPSLDRKDNSKGYIPGNVWIISHRANTIKGSTTALERKLLYEVCKDLG